MPSLPVVCTLTPETLKTRREGLLASLVARASEHQGLPDGHRLRCAVAEDLLGVIARRVDAERQCCRFLRFQIMVEPDGGPIRLDLTGPPGTREFVAALLARQ